MPDTDLRLQCRNSEVTRVTNFARWHWEQKLLAHFCICCSCATCGYARLIQPFIPPCETWLLKKGLRYYPSWIRQRRNKLLHIVEWDLQLLSSISHFVTCAKATGCPIEEFCTISTFMKNCTQRELLASMDFIARKVEKENEKGRPFDRLAFVLMSHGLKVN